MSDSLPSPSCPKCGAALPADAAEGLCPRCLMAEAMQPTGPKKTWEPPTAAELGELLPEYDIEKLLGRGGMGAVYKGRQKSLDRPVAIKILSATLDESDQGFAERFKNEARALGKLKHPGIVGVYDFGTAADGLLYIVMEFIDGTDVAKMIAQKGRLHTDHAMAITAHVCDALAYAHSQGIIHRDIKPANIMVGYDGVVQVADFGLAKVSIDGQTLGLTQSGMAMGTMHYMAPESLTLGTSVDHRADIYAMGVMLYQMLTGKLPQGLFSMPSLQIKGLDPRYDGIIGRALMEDRDARYQTITEMRMGLDEILTQPVVKAEAGAGKTPAALNTQARPKRPGGPQAPPPEAAELPPAEKRTSLWLWAVLIVILGLGVWEYFRKRPAETHLNVSATTDDPAAATKEQPFVNSLGMKFVPVPGTNVLMCIHETRRQDYAAFAKEVPSVNAEWKAARHEGIPCGDKDNHPVVNVNWFDAQSYCAWLSKKEGSAYRLPNDHEWSIAVGVGKDEIWGADTTPASVIKNTTQFPWGMEWPPPRGAGNYMDVSWNNVAFKEVNKYDGEYTDGFPTTAPVMSFEPNALGLYDMGGNLWEWCEDWFDKEHNQVRVLRGASWADTETWGGYDGAQLGSFRARHTPNIRYPFNGFRVVLDLGTEAAESAPVSADAGKADSASSAVSAVPATVPASGTTAVPAPAPLLPATPTKEQPFVNSLGMKFVPVPGTNVLMCIHETRRKDFSSFAEDQSFAGTKWKSMSRSGVPVGHEDDHPVVGVSWVDAKAFCDWLGRKEGQLYRLPKDSEWSFAVGIADLEKQFPTKSPLEFNDKVPERFPWGVLWPPPAGAGNFADESLRKAGVHTFNGHILGYNDGYPTTAPVMSFAPNGLGIYDLAGNVTEWCEDWVDEAQTRKVHRGRSWDNCERDLLRSSWRSIPFHTPAPDECGEYLGFRVVVEFRADLPMPTQSSETLGDPPNTTRRVIDLIPLVDLPRDASNGAWSKTPEGISLAKVPDSSPRIQFPHSIATDEYDYEVEISYAHSDMEHRLGFPVFGRRIDWAMNVFSGSETPTYFFVDLDGFSAAKAKEAVVRLPQLKQGSRHHTRIKVRKGELAAFFDGKQVVRWQGDTKRFNPSPRNVRDPQFPDLFFYWGGIHIHKATVTEFVPKPASPPAPSVAPVTKEQPFVNSLGMKFVPVPETNVYFCIHEVRYKDFAAYAAESPDVDDMWKNQTLNDYALTERTEDHPVVNVRWEDAQKFCVWLSKKEGKAYRLPTDQEWSYAVGIGRDEKWEKDTTPATVSKSQTDFPWGAQWPPPKGSGNFSDDSRKAKAPYATAQYLEGYDDGFPTTAPVMSFKPNNLGLYDLEGNVREWVEDWWDNAKADRVLRGGCWHYIDRAYLLSSCRVHNQPGGRYSCGFRIVVEVRDDTAQSPTAANKPDTLGDPPNTTRRVIDLIKTASMLPAPHVDTWAVKGTDLEFLKGGEIVFPHACGTQEYDLDFEFTVLTEAVNSIGHSFPTNAGRCAFTMQLFREHPGPFWGFATLDKVHYAFAKEARVVKDYPPLFEAGKRYQTTVKVRDGSLEAYLDGRLLVHWEGDQSRFTTGENNLPHPRHPKFGVYDGRAIIHKATVTEFVPKTTSPLATAPAPSRITPATVTDKTLAPLLARATKDTPFVNSLGMKFVPVAGTKTLFCVHETRRQDYAAFAAANPDTNNEWMNQRTLHSTVAGGESDHPVVGVSWHEAAAFCAWLSKQEGCLYSLPTDWEWSQAVGIADHESTTPDSTPELLSEKLANVYPWGSQWPPPARAGNYADTAWRRSFSPDLPLDGYADGFPTTAPVMSFQPNGLGLYDLGGNVWEWCQDWWNSAQNERVLRGGCWNDLTFHQNVWLSSFRFHRAPDSRDSSVGFRCVIEIERTTARNDAATKPPAAPLISAATQLEQQYQAAIAKQVTPAVEAYAKTLLTSYRSALERASKASGTSPAEAAALKAEIVRVSNEAVMPLSDAPGISAAIAALRSTYRKALEAFRVEKTAPLKAVYDKQLQEQVKINADKASQTPGPSSMPPDGSTSSPRVPKTPTAADHLRWRQIAERLLALKAELVIAEGKRPQNIRAVDELPSGPFTLRHIWLIDGAVTDEDLAMLAGSSELSHVNIDRASITRFPFASLPGLESFHYNGGLCTDDTLVGIENCQRLTDLFISGSKLSKTSLRRLKNCPKLERLCLSATNIDSDGLNELGQLINLKHVDLSHTQTTGRGLSELQGLSLLEALVITHLDLTGSNLDFLSNFKNLNKLTANSTKFDDKHFLLIGGLKALKGLDLEDVQMNDRHVATISQCLSLEELVAPRTEITGTGFLAVAEWPSLARLNLAGTRLSKDGLRSVTETCPHLTELTLPAAPLSPDNMSRLSKLTKLKSLEIQDGRFDRTWVPFMERMDQLKWLHLTRTTVSDADVAAIAKLTRLTRLGLTGTQITDACIPDLMKLKSLSELWLGETAVTEAGLAKLRDFFPAATIHR